ncbi:MAG: DUF1674 domain-containing protein [Gammaproteobacteria bacterium]|nr:DUF1674 domain-containing protein [Gammaproteobacteria bacterium]
MSTDRQKPKSDTPPEPRVWKPGASEKGVRPKEVGGRKDGLEPTRYGDWEKNGRCIDF